MGLKTNIKAGMVVSALLFLLFSCHHPNSEPEETIPLAPVNLRIDLNHEGRNLLEPLAYSIFTEPRLYGERLGHAGILVVHNMGAHYTYSAYDLICPYDYPDRITIEVVEDNYTLLSAECPKCHTVYNLAMGVGNPIEGVGKVPLIQYQVAQQQYLLVIHL